MPAPSSAVLTACRAGTVQRHLLLYLNHPAGVVRVWDGVGNLTYSGNTYTGLGGLGSLQGISDSADIQQHEVTCTLDNVALSAMRADDGDVRGVAASIYAVLLQENGTTLARREMFTGYGDVLKSRIHGSEATYTLTLRGLLADWSDAPKAYYTPTDQQRIHATDDGFYYVKQLQDSTVSGWGEHEETSGSVPTVVRPNYVSFNTLAAAIQDNITGELYGNEAYGLSFSAVATPGQPLLRRSSGTVNYKTETTSTNTTNATGTAGALQVSGVDCYISISGLIRNVAGELIQGNSSTSEDLRKVTPITSNGSATAETIDFPDVGTGGVARVGWKSTTSGTASATQVDWRGVIFNNATGGFIYGDSGASYVASSRHIPPGDTISTLQTYVEDVSGTSAIVSSSGAGKLQVGGVNCVISDTGVVLSASGRRIYRSGGSATTDFLRIWT